MNAPSKVLCFVWLEARQVRLTHENLRRGYRLSSRCCLCEREAEDNTHLFLQYSVITSQLWHVFLSIVKMNWIMPKVSVDLLRFLGGVVGGVSQKK